MTHETQVTHTNTIACRSDTFAAPNWYDEGWKSLQNMHRWPREVFNFFLFTHVIYASVAVLCLGVMPAVEKIPERQLGHVRVFFKSKASDEEAKVRNADARKAFLAADVDGNGYLDHDEVRSLAISLGATDERKLQEAIADMDKDVNNEIDLQEFMRWWRRKDDMISSTDSGGFFGRLKKVTNQHGNAENLKADLEHRRRDSDESLSDEDRELDTNGMLRSKDSLDFEDDSEPEEDIEEEWWYDTSEEEDDGEKEE